MLFTLTNLALGVSAVILHERDGVKKVTPVKQFRVQAPFDLSPYKVSDTPNTWVIDGLLPSDLIERVSNAFADGTSVDRSKVLTEKDVDMNDVDDRIRLVHQGYLELSKEDTDTISNTMLAMSHCETYAIQEYMIAGKVTNHTIVEAFKYPVEEDGAGHMDRYPLPATLNKHYKDNQFSSLHDTSDPSSPDYEAKNQKGDVVPRYSMIINMNGEGGIRFLKTGLDIPAKTGRITMWENYKPDGTTVDWTTWHQGYMGESGAYKHLILGGVYYEGPAHDLSSQDRIKGCFLIPTGMVGQTKGQLADARQEARMEIARNSLQF